jgi:hypothetical protein
MTNPELAAALLDTVKIRNDRFIWFAHIQNSDKRTGSP